MFDFAIKAILLIAFFGVMVGIGIYCRRHATGTEILVTNFILSRSS